MMILLLLFFCITPVLADDVLCEAVERVYPLELLDVGAWRSACRSAGSAEAALAALDDPLAEVAPAPEGAARAAYYHVEGSTVGMIHLTGFAGGAELVDQFDFALEQARYEDGLILDLRGARGGEPATAYAVLSRLTLARVPGVRITQREPGTDQAREIHYSAEPRGPWQFDLPIVILVDEGTAWPSDALLYAARRRSQIESVGRPTEGTRGVEPVPVALGEDVVALIPSASARTPEGKLLRGQPFVPGVNVNTEQMFLGYSGAPDPILKRGLDELYRMIGRLEWLQDEYRRELLRQDSLKRRGR